MKRVYLTGFCSLPRTEGLSRITETVNRFGYVLEHKFFSDLNASFIIEAEGHLVPFLIKDLRALMAIKEEPEGAVSENSACTLLLNVSFSSGTGDLKVEVPAVPG